MRIRHSVSALTLLLILSAISGCKPQPEKTIELTKYHTPVIYVYEGQVIKFHPSEGDLTLTPDQGLCTESGPVHGTPDRPAVCTIARQTFHGDEPNKYKLTVSGSDGVSYQVAVKPCKGC